MSEPPDTPLVSPFNGERFSEVERLGDLVAPPYDEIPAQLRRRLAERDPHNIVQLIVPQGKGDKYESAAHLLNQWRQDGALIPDRQESVYVVRQEFETPDGRNAVRCGAVAAVAVEPFSKGRVKPHVKTHADPKNDRLALLSATDAMFEALLLLGRDETGDLRARLEQAATGRPLAQADVEDGRVTMWQVTDVAGREIANLASAGALYLADGHHRYEAALEYKQRNPNADRTVGMIVPADDPGLTILPTHRVVYGASVDVDLLVDRVQERFQVHELTRETDFVDHLHDLRDRGTACVVLRRGGSGLSLLLKGGAKLGDLPFGNDPAVASLDVARVDEMVVKPLLSQVGKDGRLGYGADPAWVVNELASGNAQAAVLLNPASVEQVLAVADAGSVMPQKATYFTPKVPSGLVILSWQSRGNE
jgi:uncharacterized protein (DUF1015 family)